LAIATVGNSPRMMIRSLRRDTVNGTAEDEGYLASVSMMDRLPGWRKLADEMGALS
jgi:hypothetical protein